MFRFSIPLLLTLSACAPVGSIEPTPGQEPGTPGAVEGSTGSGEVQPVPEEQIRVGPGLGEESCKAEAAQGMIGRSASEAVVKDATRATGAKSVRVIPHDGMVTMDYRGDRLNIQLDEQGKIVAITCG
jgi:Peptidase inhibitor I78 family